MSPNTNDLQSSRHLGELLRSDYSIATALKYNAIDNRHRFGALRRAPALAFHELCVGLDGRGQFLRYSLNSKLQLENLIALTLQQVDVLVRRWRIAKRIEEDALQAMVDNALHGLYP